MGQKPLELGRGIARETSVDRAGLDDSAAGRP